MANNRSLRNPESNHSFINNFKVPNKKTLNYIYGDSGKTFHITEGTVRSGKTTDNVLLFCAEIEKSPDRTFLAIAQTHSLAKAILFDGDGLGIQHYPDWQERTEIVDGKPVRFRQRIFLTKYKGQDALALKPKHNSNHPIKYIIAYGGSKANSFEAFKGLSAGMFIATQWELLHPLTRTELMKRTVASSHRKHIIDLNPTSPKHQVYKDMDRWIEAGSVNYVLKLMQDNPIMTPKRIEEVVAEYDPDSVDFQRDILGKRVAAEGSIYKVRDYNIISDFDVDDYLHYVIVADPGVNHSATSFVLVALSKDRKHIDVLKSYYHKNANESGLGVKMPEDYAVDYINFIKECMNLMGRPPMDVLTDTDVTFVREFERNKYIHNLGGINLNRKFHKEKIHDRIKTGINLLWKKRLRFYDKNKEVIEAYKAATYNEKEKDKGNFVRFDNPQEGTMIDPIDAVEYGITRMRNEWNEWRGD